MLMFSMFSISIISCPPGTMISSYGNCISCPPRFYCGEDSIPTICPEGYFCPYRSSFPYTCSSNGVFCPEGSYRPNIL